MTFSITTFTITTLFVMMGLLVILTIGTLITLTGSRTGLLVTLSIAILSIIRK